MNESSGRQLETGGDYRDWGDYGDQWIYTTMIENSGRQLETKETGETMETNRFTLQ